MENHVIEKRERLFSLDLLRGIDMFYLACGGALIPAVLKWLDAPPAYLRFLKTHPWSGFTLWDLIMPLFIFMCGAAVPFALGRRLGPDGRPDTGYWRHVWGRVALLWGLGMFVQGELASLDIHRIALYSNALQTIAVGYLVAAILLPVRRVAVKVAVPLALIVAYGLIVHFGGDYTKDGNISQKVDLAVWGALLPEGSAAVEVIRKYGSCWLLPSMMFPVITLAGCFSTQILKCGRMGEWRKAACLIAFGGASLAAGWALYFLGVDMVKHIFTVSFTLQAIGWSVLLLAALYVLTDIWKLRRGMGLFILFGQFALTAYLCKTVFYDAVQSVSDRLFAGIERFFPADFAPVVKAVGFSVVITAVLHVRRRMANRLYCVSDTPNKRTKPMRKALTTFAAVFAAAIAAFAADVEWTGTSGDGLWATTGNWSGGAIPTKNDTAVFDLSGAAMIDLDWANRQIAGLTVSAGRLCLTNGALSCMAATTTVHVVEGAYLVVSNMVRSDNADYVLKLSGGGKMKFSGKIGRSVYGSGDASKPFARVLVSGANPEFACETFQNAAITATEGSVLDISNGGWSYNVSHGPNIVDGATLRFLATETPGTMAWPSSLSTANWQLKVGEGGVKVTGLFDETFSDSTYRQLGWYATSSAADGVATDGGIEFSYPGVTTLYKPQSVSGGVTVSDGRVVFASGAGATPFGTGDFTISGGAIWPNSGLADAGLAIASGEGATFTYGRGGSINVMRASDCAQTVTIGPAGASATSLVRAGKGSTLAIMKSISGLNGIGSAIDGRSGRVFVNGGVETHAVGLVKEPIFGYGKYGSQDTTYVWEFLQYDADKGLVSATNLYTTGFGGGSGSIASVNVSTADSTTYTLETGTTSVLALAIRCSAANKTPLTIPNNGILSVGNGTDPACVILNNESSYGSARIAGYGTLDFGSSEGVIAVTRPPTSAATRESTIATVVAGSGGITVVGQSLTSDAVPTLTLSGANTYSGGTWVNSAQVCPANARAFGTGTVDVGCNMACGGQVKFATADLAFTNSFRIKGFGVKQQSDETDMDNGALWFTESSMISGAVEIDGKARITTRDATSGTVARLSGVVSGGTLQVANTADDTCVLLSGSNTYTGGTEVVSATLVLTGANAAGTGDITLNGGTLRFENESDVVFANAVTGSGTVVVSGRGKVTFTDDSFGKLKGVALKRGTSFAVPGHEGTIVCPGGLTVIVR